MVTACLVREMVLTLIVPVAPANAPVPPVTLPLVTTPVLKLNVNVPDRNPPLVSTVVFTARVLADAALKYRMSKPTVLPTALTSVSWMPPVALVKLTVAVDRAMYFSVCVAAGALATAALCALATAGSKNHPVVPRTTAAPAAARDVRSFMIAPPCLRGITGPNLGPMIRPAGRASQGPAGLGGRDE